ncbi:hypothetical protein [Sphingobium limneticum]|jgi:hypothetical protein|uniref:Spore coat protein U domain-containing protein n=1 Tax=Sphingobium limneticum TaxID=1007511 RepID=A0A5J5I1L9_9SPHN|nr:hypothetical protein [Sphingobium limneticum]KAA9014345.1 hypothetical protein F4U96_16970 [Sphingobium limneticum]KAA9027434.1 hypothetical protein F4U95_17095 [Sphingobium limneticum]
MKSINLTALALVAAAGISAPAFAQTADTNTGLQSASVVVSATNPAKCDLTATTTALTLAGDVLTDANGVPVNNVGTLVAAELNNAGVNAWCTGARNVVTLTRTAFTTGGGGSAGDFQKGILYDVSVENPDNTLGSRSSQYEGTSNGPTGSSIWTRFGATTAKTLKFANPAANAASIATNAVSSADGTTASFTTYAATRVIAGDYTSTVTLTIQPGV